VLNKKGFTLIEVVLAIFIIGVALVTLLSMFSLGLRGDVFAREMTAATTLAQEMMEEIKSKEFVECEEGVTPDFGPETPEPAIETAADRTSYDDVDDYDGWSRNPPEDIAGNPLSDFSVFTRSVVVVYVENDNYDDPVEEGDANYPTDSKRITVTVLKGENDLIELTTVVFNHKDLPKD
jgi:prepilin-type N-terminal cleavage/methylation domain-containing protein